MEKSAKIEKGEKKDLGNMKFPGSSRGLCPYLNYPTLHKKLAQYQDPMRGPNHT